jgi:hypothetical protein
MIIDLVMIVQLRSVLKEQLEKFKSMSASSSKSESKASECEAVFHNSAKMVVINTAIGLLFKLPITFLPLLNAYAQFYYKDFNTRFEKPSFDRFFTFLSDSGFLLNLADLTNLLYLLSMVAQFFVFNRFDKKFRSGLLSVLKYDSANIQSNSVSL